LIITFEPETLESRSKAQTRV